MRSPGHPSPYPARLCAAVVFLLVLASFAHVASAGTKARLHWAEHQLHSLESDIDSARAEVASLKAGIDAAQARVNALQEHLNALAERYTLAQDAYEETKDDITTTHRSLVEARVAYAKTRNRIDARARDLYERGPGSEIEFIFGASSLADLTDRVQFVDALELEDSQLAARIDALATNLERQQHRLEALRTREEGQLRRLRGQQREISAKFDEQAGLLADLNEKRAQAASLISTLADRKDRIGSLVARFRKKLAAEERAAALAAQRASNVTLSAPAFGGDGPFSYCPVQGPHAYSDSFGAPRYAGGYHPHAGNDIMAPRGTPIVAPFDGYASSDPNGLGGNAVIVDGPEGYVYNAHLDRYGSLGNVSAGTVIGYVGDSGDAQGGPTHDHFEWHPDHIPANPYRSAYGYTVIDGAIDPYPYLNQVC